ncbi:MAG: histidinol-phosphate transaminase [Firmicutes bacterium]|nr:histidinol-phosphate transaminase [Bacillota bacterium]
MKIEWKGREAINNIKAYSPGKAIAEVKKELGLDNVYKMASNENPLGPSPLAIESIKNNMANIHIYPDGSSLILKKELAIKNEIKVENIIVGNGSDEIIKLLGESFLEEGDTIIMGDPSFSEYDYIGNLMGAKVKKIPLVNFAFNLEDILDNLDDSVKIIALCNPNNPTGTVLGKEALIDFIDRIPENIIVVLDEAYKEYAGENFFSGINFVKEGKNNVLILNTFSKIYGLAALRVGYGIGSEPLISWITRAKEPFNVNVLAQVGAKAALNDVDHVKQSIELNLKGKEFLYKEFLARGFAYSESGANFIWVDIKHDSKKVFEGLLKKGVVIRPGNVFGANNHIRVTIDKPEINKYFIDMLDEVIREI